jgi:hypothetical protein
VTNWSWQIITGTGLDDWIWHLLLKPLLITINDNSSQRLRKTRSIPYWTMSVFSSTATDLVLIYDSPTYELRILTYECIPSKWFPESESESSVTADRQSASLSWNKAPIRGLRPDFITVRHLRSCWYGALSLTRGLVWRIQLLLVLAGALNLESESLGTRDLILLSQIWDFPFCRLLRLAGSRWRYLIPPSHVIRVNCSLHDLLVTMENFGCFFVSVETFVESSLTRKLVPCRVDFRESTSMEPCVS